MSKVKESTRKGNVNQGDEMRDSSSCPNKGKIDDDVSYRNWYHLSFVFYTFYLSAA